MILLACFFLPAALLDDSLSLDPCSTSAQQTLAAGHSFFFSHSAGWNVK